MNWKKSKLKTLIPILKPMTTSNDFIWKIETIIELRNNLNFKMIINDLT